MIYEKYKNVLKVNAQQVSRKSTEAWKSFFKLLKLKKENKLLCFIIPRLPGYRKDRKNNKRESFLIVRNDRYEIKDDYIYLKDFKLKLKYRGRIHLKGKQRRLEIHYNSVRKR